MNISIPQPTTYGRTCAAIILSVLFLAGCASSPVSPDGASDARSNLTALQNDPELSSRARVEIRQAEEAVKLAEEPLSDSQAALGEHRVYMAEHRVEIAKARAAAKLAEDQRAQLDQDRSDTRLTARTREADRARSDASRARSSEADMQRRLEELEAKETERGMVITLGDVLFDTGSAQLRGDANHTLNKLVSFMRQYPDQRLVIEGHTDNVGGTALNQRLSQQRADSVRQYLTQNNIASNRISTSGMGLHRPIADNNSAAGRQQNRRVEIVIE